MHVSGVRVSPMRSIMRHHPRYGLPIIFNEYLAYSEILQQMATSDYLLKVDSDRRTHSCMS